MKKATAPKSNQEEMKCPKHWGDDYWFEVSRTETSDFARLNLELTCQIIMNKIDALRKVDDNYRDLLRWWLYYSALKDTDRTQLQRSMG